ncbi:MAG: hypothetical protein QOE92_2547 [Chloroflexota bacterium]|jgi:hypothetical protein|nr:hypothetical protein [Chloroflexota bacterium]
MAGMAVLTTSCGSSSAPPAAAPPAAAPPAPNELLAAAVAAMKSLKYYHLSVVSTDPRLSGEIDYSQTDDEASGTVGNPPLGMMFVRSDGIYLRGPDLIRALCGDMARDRVGDGWGHISRGRCHTAGPDLKGTTNCLLRHHGQLRSEGSAIFDGQEVHLLSDAGDAPGSIPSRISIAATGPPYILRQEQTGDPRPGGSDPECLQSFPAGASFPLSTTTLSRFNEPPVLPSPSNVTDLDPLVPQ